MRPTVGQPAPDFSLADQHNKKHSLKKYRGKWVLLYFYPEDDTEGCIKEACAIRDVWSLFEGANTQVLGVSPDSVSSHTDFADKYTFQFPILSDEDKKVIHMYGAWGEKNLYGHKFIGLIRSSYLIDPTGIIAKVYPRVIPAKHAAQVLKDVAVFSLRPKEGEG